jgi:hypothetical protein
VVMNAGRDRHDALHPWGHDGNDVLSLRAALANVDLDAIALVKEHAGLRLRTPVLYCRGSHRAYVPVQLNVPAAARQRGW